MANSKTKIIDKKISHKITVKDIEQAEFEIFKEAQLECFQDEFRTLKKDMSLSKHSKLLPLNPIVVDNLIRVGGRVVSTLRAKIPNASNKGTYSLNFISIR